MFDVSWRLLYVPLSLGFVSLVAFLYLRVKKGGLTALFAKTAVSMFFVWTALAAMYPSVFYYDDTGHILTYSFNSQHAIRFGLLIIFGLVCGLLGDIWLDQKFIYKQDGDTLTFAGFISFMTGHFAFITAIFALDYDGFRDVPLALAVGIAAAAILLLTEKPMKLNYGKFKLITAAYCVVIFFFTALAGPTALKAEGVRRTGMILLFLGGIFFAVSDLILSGTYFGTGKDRPKDIILNHATYYIAQYFIAVSLLYIV